jgi:hypothetical protein
MKFAEGPFGTGSHHRKSGVDGTRGFSGFIERKQPAHLGAKPGISEWVCRELLAPKAAHNFFGEDDRIQSHASLAAAWGLCSLPENRKVTIVGENPVALSAGEFAPDSAFHEQIHAGRGGRKGKVRSPGSFLKCDNRPHLEDIVDTQS